MTAALIGNTGVYFAAALAAFLVLFALSAVTIARRADDSIAAFRREMDALGHRTEVRR